MGFDFSRLDLQFDDQSNRMLTQKEVNSIFEDLGIRKERQVNSVLVVDDATFIRAVQKNILTQNGYYVTGEARDGEEAVEKYNEAKPDLVIMNIIMPVMDGIAATEAIKTSDDEAQVVMFSTISSYQFVKRSILAGACGFIVEEFDKENFLQAIADN